MSFATPSRNRTEVAFTTELGTFVVELFEDTPVSTAKFIDNIVNHRYTGGSTAANVSAFIQRRESDFVIQGGGFFIDSNSLINQIVNQPKITGETGVHANSIYTLSFALAGNDPATAGLDWFINLRDNASLLAQYPVFGQLVGATSAFDAAVALPTYNFSGSLGPSFATVPLLHGATAQTAVVNDLLKVGYDILGVANADSGSTGKAAVLNGTTLFANDVDLDTPTLAVAAVNGAAYAAGSVVTLPSGAQLTINADGTYVYNPNHAFDSLSGIDGAVAASTVDSFTYTLRGGHLVAGTATVTIAIAGTNDGHASGTAGNDTLTGGAAGDLYMLQQGGSDTVHAGGGDDAFYLGAAWDAGDVIDGGAGAADELGVQGNTTIALSATSLIDVERLVFLPGSDNRFGDSSGALYSYTVTSHDANVAAGQTLAVQANTLRVGENLTFNGSAELDGKFLFFGGQGADHLIGGQQDDSFYFGADGRWGSGDTVDGQGGADLLGLQGSYAGANAIAFGAGQLTSIETISLGSGADTSYNGGASLFGYTLTMHDGNVAAGAQMTVQAGNLRAGEVLTLDASAEQDGSYHVFGGGGDDRITGGALADDLWGGAGSDIITGGLGADTLHGGAGNDVFRYLTAADSTVAARDRIFDFTSGDTIDASAAGMTSFHAGGFTGAAGQMTATYTGTTWLVEGDVNGDGVADLSIQVDQAANYVWSGADFHFVI